jgi:hypothetical protein
MVKLGREGAHKDKERAAELVAVLAGEGADVDG